MSTGGYGSAPVPCMRILKFYALRIRRKRFGTDTLRHVKLL